MRLWTIHPTYLDSKGLVALWREGLLALHVLRGHTKGYTQHPQLLRFKNHPQPLLAMTAYLHAVADEAEARSFSFSREKLDAFVVAEPIVVTAGQLRFETEHLKKKLSVRDQQKFLKYESFAEFDPHPLFTIVPGEVEPWEKGI